VGKQTFFKFRKLQIRKLFGSFLYHKSTDLLGVQVRKSQIREFSAKRKSETFDKVQHNSVLK
jgi:hypothetical protein